jgi:hypothetical protein
VQYNEGSFPPRRAYMRSKREVDNDTVLTAKCAQVFIAMIEFKVKVRVTRVQIPKVFFGPVHLMRGL